MMKRYCFRREWIAGDRQRELCDGKFYEKYIIIAKKNSTEVRRLKYADVEKTSFPIIWSFHKK